MTSTRVKSVGHLYSLANDYLRVELIDYGATVTSILAPDRDGVFGDVLLGCPTPLDYLNPHPHFNCLVGRFANRMTQARFRLNGEEYRLEPNIPPHHLHGGSQCFANRLWSSHPIEDGVSFSLTSEDGDAGYPGKLEVVAEYRLLESALDLRIHAETTRPTPVSLTAHHYFNLSGAVEPNAHEHILQLNADHYLPVSEDLTQIGQIEPVANSPFDLRKPTRLGEPLLSDHPQIQLAEGVDHSFVINGDGMRECAILTEPQSGRQLTVITDQPAVQLYTTNSLRSRGKQGVRYSPHDGICLETQQFPDAPNHENYPNAILNPGEIYEAHTRFEFGIGSTDKEAGSR